MNDSLRQFPFLIKADRSSYSFSPHYSGNFKKFLSVAALEIQISTLGLLKHRFWFTQIWGLKYKCETPSNRRKDMGSWHQFWTWSYCNYVWQPQKIIMMSSKHAQRQVTETAQELQSQIRAQLYLSYNPFIPQDTTSGNFLRFVSNDLSSPHHSSLESATKLTWHVSCPLQHNLAFTVLGLAEPRCKEADHGMKKTRYWNMTLTN